jgi:ABC-2 type transport system permease protein
MSGPWHGWRASARLDWGDVRRSRWLWLTQASCVLLGGVLVVAGMRESSVFGFTGMGRVLLSFAHLLLVVLPLLALSATTQLVPRARDDGTIELLFSHPLSRVGYLAGVATARVLALAVPLVATLLAMGALGRILFAEPIPWPMLWHATSLGLALLVCFIGIGLFVSVSTRGQAKAVVHGLVVWVASVALVDMALLGALLQWRLHPRVVFFLAGINPVQMARLGLLSGIEPDLASLGPVGFYLAHAWGASKLHLLGIVGPSGLGAVAFAAAAQRFSRGDLV